jgi:hypothetical protein
MNQIKNISKQVRATRKLTKDEIYNLVLLGYHLEGFIHEIKIFPDLVTILGLPEFFDIFNQLLDVDDSCISTSLCYDTIFLCRFQTHFVREQTKNPFSFFFFNFKFSCIKILKDEIKIPSKSIEPSKIVDYVTGTLGNLEHVHSA